MNIEKETGEMVVGAMALGMALNQKSEDAKEANYWHNYALTLQSQLNAQRQLSNAQDRVIAEKNAQIDTMGSQLAASQRVIEETRAELAKQTDYKDMNGRELNVALDNLKALRSRLVSQSAQTRSINVLYEKLVNEVNCLVDPSLLPSLDADERRKIIDQEMTEWKEKGKLSYVPEFGGPDRLQLKRKVNSLIETAEKFQQRTDLLGFLADSITKLTDEIPSLSPQKADAVAEYSQRLLATLNEVRNPATFETLDPVAKLDEVKAEWESFHRKTVAGSARPG